MWPFKRKEPFFWDDRYFPLAVYNSEVERGIVHTDEWKEKMSKLQVEYDAERMNSQAGGFIGIPLE